MTIIIDGTGAAERRREAQGAASLGADKVAEADQRGGPRAALPSGLQDLVRG